MWKILHVADEKTAEGIMASPGTFRTAALQLMDLEDETTSGILGKVKGVRTLEIRQRKLTNPHYWMNSPALADLNNLTLLAMAFHDTPLAELHPAFRLRKPHLLKGSGVALPAVLNSLFATSSSTLLSLSLHSIELAAHPALLGLGSLPLLANANTLKTLTYTCALGQIHAPFGPVFRHSPH